MEHNRFAMWLLLNLIILPTVFVIGTHGQNLSCVSCTDFANGNCISSKVIPDEFKTIETKYGKIRGTVLRTVFDKTVYYSFKGIPFAAPPLGELRFKPPQEINAWNGTVLDATEYRASCLQSKFQCRVILEENEDCLFLNVFTLDTNPVEKLPVIVYIFGGMFIEGGANDAFYGADFLVEKRAIVVNFNSRLGVFGWMSLSSAEYSGNMGLKDQLFALKWINENIHSFGGDNTKVTLMGHSSGAGLAHLHVLSETSRKYFQRAILMSGSALCDWAIADQEDHLSFMYSMASDMGASVNNYTDLVKFLKNAPADEIVKRSAVIPRALDSPVKDFAVFWGPIIENEQAVEIFLTKYPEVTYKNVSMDIDILIGFLSEDFMNSAEIHNSSLLEPFDKHFHLGLPFRGEESFASDEYKAVAPEIRRHYFGNKSIGNETIKKFLTLMQDVNFFYNIDQTVKLQVNVSTGNTFYYRFAVDSTLNLFKQAYNDTIIPGTCHGDELCYIFRCDVLSSRYNDIINNGTNSISYRSIQYMSKLWTNFAKYGSPTFANDPIAGYKPVTNNEINYLNIADSGLTLGIDPHKDSVDFWNKIHEKYVQIQERNQNKK